MMRLSNLHVRGFRSLADIKIPLHDFTILIGRNNSGKSNVLLALKLLLEGTARDLSEEDFHAQGKQRAERIVLETTFEGVDGYLPLCADRHRTKIADCIVDGVLRVRRLASRSPLELGKLELWQPDRDDFGLPTGIESALKQILPEVILIEAFKDPTAEAQAKSSAALGKLIRQIVEQVAGQVEADVKGALDQAARKFNIVEQEGQVVDDRPEELKRIEQRIKRHIQSIFEGADARLKFNLPDVANLMASATVELKDRGPWTPPEGKGQGFQRALYLALLQALAEELRVTQGDVHRPFIVLFEEPEAFLHPALQREMGEVLESVSKNNQVVIATHSPLLVTPHRVCDVMILRQMTSPDVQLHATCCLVPDLDLLPDAEDKQLAALLRFTSSAEFLFADCVLVVEGPSDRALLEASWSVLRQSLSTEERSIAMAIIEAGNKMVVPVWAKCLKAMGFTAQGVVDLDFLWNGAGKCLGADSDLSKFVARFWQLVEECGISGVTESGRSIPAGKKKEIFGLVLGSLAEKVQSLRNRLRDESGIWVLGEGEIEHYFGLSSSSKGQHATASQRVRNGEIEIPPEVRAVLGWAVSMLGSQTKGAA